MMSEGLLLTYFRYYSAATQEVKEVEAMEE
jgi:hypothetical protein